MTEPTRIRLSRRKGWRKPEGAIVVARPTRWGNPYSVERWGRALAVRLFDETAHGRWRPSLLDGYDDEQVAVAHRAHEAWLSRLGGDPLDVIPHRLAGHDLACWCPLDQPCHADVLLAVANGRA